jgi:diguanylate cyclase (GGDEF)-like protein/PAS domain S-box-containing protein
MKNHYEPRRKFVIHRRRSESTTADSSFRKTEELLRQSEERYRELFENANDIVYTHDLAGNFTSLNKAAERITGYSRQEALKMNFADVIAPEDLDKARTMVQRKVAENVSTTYEIEVVTKNNERVTLEVSTRLIYQDGAPVAVQGIARDITDRKQAERMLRESEMRLKALVGSIDEIVFEFDQEGTYLNVWTANEDLLSHPRKELIGRRATEFFDEEFMRPFLEAFKRVLGSGQAESIEYPLNLRGETHWFLARISPIPSADGSYKTVCMFARDITDRNKAEEALRNAYESLGAKVNELQQHKREITLLGEMGGMLQACLTVDEAYTVISQAAQQLFAGEQGALCVLSESQAVVEPVSTWGQSQVTQVFGPDECWALRRGRTHNVPDTRDGLICKHLTRPLPGAYICVQLMAQGKTLGILHLSQPEPTRLNQAKQQLVVTMAEHAALALSNLRHYETLVNQSTRDPLTNLFNRRCMEESLKEELRRAQPSQRQLTLIMLDLDHFKRFNDTFGHDAGDAILREVGKLLGTNFRGEDIACRYGGDEFTVILPVAPLEVAEHRAQELRRAIKDLEIPYFNPTLDRVTVSMGIARFPEHGSNAETLLRSADRALYRAKAAGRNCIEIAT